MTAGGASRSRAPAPPESSRPGFARCPPDSSARARGIATAPSNAAPAAIEATTASEATRAPARALITAPLPSRARGRCTAHPASWRGRRSSERLSGRLCRLCRRSCALSCPARRRDRLGEQVILERRVERHLLHGHLARLSRSLDPGFRYERKQHAVDLAIVAQVACHPPHLAVEAPRAAFDLRLEERLPVDPDAAGVAVLGRQLQPIVRPALDHLGAIQLQRAALDGVVDQRAVHITLMNNPLPLLLGQGLHVVSVQKRPQLPAVLAVINLHCLLPLELDRHRRGHCLGRKSARRHEQRHAPGTHTIRHPAHTTPSHSTSRLEAWNAPITMSTRCPVFTTLPVLANSIQYSRPGSGSATWRKVPIFSIVGTVSRVPDFWPIR